MVLPDKKVTHNVKSHATRESSASTGGSTLFFGASARSDSLQEEGGVADFSEADCDAVEAREDFWSMSWEFVYHHHVTLGEQLDVPKESSFTIPSACIDVVRKTTTNLGQLGTEQY